MGQNYCIYGTAAGNRTEPGQMPELGKGLLHAMRHHVEGHKTVESWPEPAASWGLVGSCIINWASVSPFSSSAFINSFVFFWVFFCFSQYTSSISFLCSGSSDRI